MGNAVRKIINDPVHGFITIDNPLVFRVVGHPWYQRLRRIQQMAFAHLVYPGAVHSRLHHSLGAYHLMGMALGELRNKGVEISPEEETAAQIAILLHDIGHGPFSHALEHGLIKGVSHETISLLLMQQLNREMEGALDLAISIFTNSYPKLFLHQLISGQLDVDRLDYLSRDSFFTGVSEGVIGYDRIIKMLCVKDGQLMVEEKGIYSTEKFLLSRRLMYWQVYLHKTVVSAEKMLVRIIERSVELTKTGRVTPSGSLHLDFFLANSGQVNIEQELERFCSLDDHDIMGAIKNWTTHPDKVLSKLCKSLLNRQLLKVKLQPQPFSETVLQEKKEELSAIWSISQEEAAYFLFTGEAKNTTYDLAANNLNILFKDGTVKAISQVDHALIQESLAQPVKKYYICHPSIITI
jgi:hypothetical protein